jgi:hypothetical protein
MIPRAKDGRRRRLNRTSHGLGLSLGALEGRMMLTASVISGYVYHDATGDGVYDAGDRPIAGSPIQLVNAAKVVVGSTTTDASGKYVFSSDGMVQSKPETSTQSVPFPATSTNFTKAATVSQFNPTLGKLTSVDVTLVGTLTSHIQVESRDATPTTITGRVEGTLTAQVPGVADLTLRPTSTRSFPASAYDGVQDYAGTSGKDFGAVSADDSKTVTLTTPGDLAAFIGTGTVPVSVAASSSSAASGPGNLLSAITSSGAATMNVVYHYLPQGDLKPGRYSIVQASQPDGYLQGVNSRGGVTVPKSAGVNTIPVTLGAGDLTDNNFGEVLPNSLSGFVYLDANRNGVKDSNEFGVATVKVTLRGKDAANNPVILSTKTDANGLYQFNDLRPGQYTITEAQPRILSSGQETIGNQGGQVSRNRFSKVVLRADAQGVNYNFGERTRLDCSLDVDLSRVDRGLPLRGTLGPNIRRYLPGLVTYNAQHPRRRA